MKNYQIFLINNSTRFMVHYEDFEGDINSLKDQLTKLQKDNYTARNAKPSLTIKTVQTQGLFMQIIFAESNAYFSFFAII